jgi:hypothetical protein
MVIMIIVFVFSCSKSRINEKEAQQILHDFYTDRVPEPINDRHLLNAGKGIVPYLIIEIQKKDMPKRGYAILALGKIGDRRALPELTNILKDRSDEIHARSDAIRAIWHIDKKYGEEFARKFYGENHEIDRTIELLRGSNL